MRNLNELKKIAANEEIKKIESDIIYVLSENSHYYELRCSKVLDKEAGITCYNLSEVGIVNVEEVKKALDEAGYQYTVEEHKFNISFTVNS